MLTLTWFTLARQNCEVLTFVLLALLLLLLWAALLVCGIFSFPLAINMALILAAAAAAASRLLADWWLASLLLLQDG